MRISRRRTLAFAAIAGMGLVAATTAHAAQPAMGYATAEPVRIAVLLSLLAIIPGLFICMTSFVRIIVVLSMIRHAFGMPETPPNQVLVSLALFLTSLTMLPAFGQINTQALQPFLAGHMADAGYKP